MTVAVVAVLSSRVLVVAAVRRAVAGGPLAITRGEGSVFVWAGLRGALTIALALGLPPDAPARDLLIAMAFGVVLFTLVVQGLTLPLLIRRLGLARVDAAAAVPAQHAGAEI